MADRTNTATNKNPYLYNGKLKQSGNPAPAAGEMFTGEFYNWYDYGARMYDPQLGRWHSVDPMAELSRRWSSYAYCYNNPLKFIELDGMLPFNEIKWNNIGDIGRGINDEAAEILEDYFQRDVLSRSEDSYMKKLDLQIKKPSINTIFCDKAKDKGNKKNNKSKKGNNNSSKPNEQPAGGGDNVYGLPGYIRLGTTLLGMSLGISYPHLPDAVSISGGVKIITGVGGSEIEGGYIWLLNGPKAGTGSSMADLGMFAGGIPSASAGVTITEYYYMSGDYSNFGFDNIRDGRLVVYGSVGEVANVGGGTSIMGNKGSGYVVGISFTISVGVSVLPLSIDANWGKTYIKK